MIVHSSKMNFKEVVDDLLGSPLQRHKGYFGEVVPILEEETANVAKKAAAKLRKVAPRASGKYAKGWASKKDTGRLTVGATVYGKSGTYQLAHLLEKPHAKRGGGRTSEGKGQITHIKPVEEWAINEAYDRIYERLEKIP